MHNRLISTLGIYDMIMLHGTYDECRSFVDNNCSGVLNLPVYGRQSLHLEALDHFKRFNIAKLQPQNIYKTILSFISDFDSNPNSVPYFLVIEGINEKSTDTDFFGSLSLALGEIYFRVTERKGDKPTILIIGCTEELIDYFPSVLRRRIGCMKV